MAVPQPQLDLRPGLSGGADLWDSEAGGILREDYFVVIPLAGTLQDNFDDNSLSTALWVNWAGAQVAETGGQIRFTSTLASGYYGLSGQFYSLYESAISVEVVNAGNQALNSLEVYPLQIVEDANNSYSIMIANGNIQVLKVLAGVQSSLVTVAYSSATHKFFRIRHTGTTLYFEYSTTGTSGWTSLISTTPEIFLGELSLEMLIGTWAAEASTTTVIFDNFNTTATSGLSGQAKIWNGSAWVAKPTKVWTGSAWVTKPVKRWNGSAWVSTNY